MDHREFSLSDAGGSLALPRPDDDKYSRGVLGVITGSNRYPGAAVLGVEAALRTGVGMLRYLGDAVPTNLVLQRRPEVVCSDGRVQAWLLGSGMDAESRDADTTKRLLAALDQSVPVVLDAGALDLVDRVTGTAIITPHHGELATMFAVERAEIAADPAGWARRAAERWGVTVLLKGSRTVIVDQSMTAGSALTVTSDNGFTATAGAGDALGGILGALVATRREGPGQVPLAEVAATGALIHREAAARAGGGGPFVVLELAEAVSAVMAGLLRGR